MEQRTFRPGDILVACDNVAELPSGYVGHSAIVVDSKQIVEALPQLPFVRKSNVSSFLEGHPLHVHYRPNEKKTGSHAAKWALKYVAGYDKNVRKGIKQPEFSFFSLSSLEDPWEAIYCSKLVWNSYYLGANYRFPNDYLWFSPEDLASRLEWDKQFTLLYKHPQFSFKLDT
ncbi:hypothetical protein [Brevibacillus sp. H7]|uniref:hypothetical protein n=1 Tax=Brevibacillus sp. H7 TaxID=3349138 RepID=UPI00380E7DBC